MIKAACAIHHEPELVTEIGNALSARYGDGSPVDPARRREAGRAAVRLLARGLVRPPQARLTAADRFECAVEVGAQDVERAVGVTGGEGFGQRAVLGDASLALAG